MPLKINEIGVININNIQLIEELQKVKGALSYDSKFSLQVLLPIENGYLRIGTTDCENKEGDFVWFDKYIIK